MKRILVKYIVFWLPSVFFLGIPVFTSNPYFLHVGILIMLNCLLAVSLMPLLRTGLRSCAHASFMAMGAYASAILVMKAGFNFWVALLAGGAVTAIFAAFIGFPTLRIRGLFFMLITFSFAAFFQLALIYFRSLTGGPDGLVGIPPPPPIPLPGGLKIEFTTKVPYYYLIFFLLLGVAGTVYRLWTTKLGRICRGISESENLVQSVGISPVKYKMVIFCTMSFFAGIAGGFYAHYVRFLGPQDFGVWASIMILVYVQVGGVYSFLGPILGASSLTVIAELFKFALMWQPIFFGALIIVTMLLFPEGMIGIAFRVKERVKRAWD